jgi:hypothetical protein
MSIMTVWLSDIKMGYCTTGWWLTEKFCCLEVSDEGESCAEWHHWGGIEPLGYLAYIMFAVSSTASWITCSRYILISGTVLVLRGILGQGIRALRCWIRYLGDQVHFGRLHHQGVLECLNVRFEDPHNGELSVSLVVRIS